MKKKNIKLTEQDLLNIVNRVKQTIKEQENGVDPFPVPQEKKEPNVPPYPEKKSLSDNSLKQTYQTQEEIVKLKKQVNARLYSAKNDLKKLVNLSGINPDNNRLCPLLDKAINEFEKLYGDPKPAEEENNV